MKVFDFYLYSGKHLQVKVEEINGQIVVGRFKPDYLYHTYGTPLFGNETNTIMEGEFNNDCQKMIDYINDNNLDYKDSLDCFDVLFAVIGSHIKKHGRIFIGDLLIYTDEMCELMFSMGYGEAIIKDIYPNFVVSIVKFYQELVKDDIPSPGQFDFTSFLFNQFDTSHLNNFVNTIRYQRLVERYPHLLEKPKL